MDQVNIIGAGLAGCEAAYQLIKRGVPVRLYEMRPQTMTPAHNSAGFGELVCSNSLRAAQITNAVGLLKEEMRRLDSLIMASADANSVPAGGALAVDRDKFSTHIEKELRNSPLVEIINEEVKEIPDGLTIIAAGPLASDTLSQAIAKLCGTDHLYFHDAIAPIIEASSINMDIAFFASRYGKGGGEDYLNCPMNKEQYLHFYQELIEAEVTPLHEFEKEKHFSGCMPIESMACYGVDSIRFGPMKPVGLELPSGGEAYAVVQLRKENNEGSAYNIVGFQTRLKQGEQKRVFGFIPGLENAEFLRYGSMHRNTYINAPKLLDDNMRLKSRGNIIFAGQISGVEGYVESAASGLMAGIFAASIVEGEPIPVFPRESAHGSLLQFLRIHTGNFQPSNINFSLFAPLGIKNKMKKKDKYAKYADRALNAIDAFKEEFKI